ncbi:hypothetical protein [Fibrella aquatilis]|uniref:Uncharacterized protein n=1 Tax=Fibrella aquatilis TaxID=2817059 RepID=A0A939G809_9BACT|nr:hypothetical protein [Fibrella aquatilis]MBO0933904.1 hypothetical protein [Fibrella aquatilis]
MIPYLNVGLLILLFVAGCFCTLVLVVYGIGAVRGFRQHRRQRIQALADAYRRGQRLSNDSPEGAMLRFTRNLFSNVSH